MYHVTLEYLVELAKKVNSAEDFQMGYKKSDLSFWISFKGKKLFPMYDDMPILMSRQDGYHLRISELFKTELELHSVEKDTKGEFYHKNFYFFTSAVAPNKVNVCIKYFDAPESFNVQDFDSYFSRLRNKVEQNPDMVIVNEPYGPINHDLKFAPNVMRTRIKSKGPF